MGSSEPQNGINYNTAGSSSVQNVQSVNDVGEAHSMPTKSEPNSVSQKYRNGKIYQERYFDENGEPYLDIDYSSHSMPGTHDNPHQHNILIENGQIIRGAQEAIK